MPDDHPPSNRGAGIAAVVLAVTAFSWGFVLVKSIGLPPPVLGFWRVLLGASILAGVAFALRVPWPRSWGMVALAGVAFGAHQLLYIAATKLTAVAIVTTVGATQPLIVMLLSRRAVGERVDPRLFAFAGLAMVGSLVVVASSLGTSSRSLLGDVLAAVNVLAFTAYFLAAKRARGEGAPTLTFTAGFLWCALPLLAPAMLVWTGPAAPTTSADWGLLLILVLGPANGHLLINWAHPRVSAALSSLILATTPVLASVWAWAVLGEALSWRHGLGIALVVVAIEGARRIERR